MNKLLLSAAALSLLAAAASAQVTGNYTFDTTVQGWTLSGGFSPGWSNLANCSGAGGSIRSNIYSGSATTTFRSPALTSLGGMVTFDFSYRCRDYNSPNGPTSAPWGSVHAEWSTAVGGPYTIIQTWTDEAQTAACIAKSVTFTPPAGPVYVRVRGVQTGATPDFWLHVDDVVLSEAQPPCSGAPAPGDTTGPAAAVCAGSTIALGLQSVTPGTGVTYQWYANAALVPGANAATYNALILANTTYYCDVTCTNSSTTTPSNPLLVTVDPTATNPQDFEAGFSGCWSNLGGSVNPDLRPVSAFGVGAQAVRFNYWSWGAATTGHVTSPVLPATNLGDRVFFDVAGTNYPPVLTWWDTIALQESSNGGATWSTVVTMDNQPGGLLYTAVYSGQFVPTPSQWQNRSFALTPGTNRIRFLGTSGFGNDAFIDNVVVGPAGYARHYQYGVACVAGYAITASPAPTPGTPVVYTANNIPQWVSMGIYGSALAVGFAADVPGTDLLTASFGTFDSPCLAHLTLGGLVDVFFLPGNAPTDTWNFTVPPLAPLGAQLFLQGVAQTDYVFPTNPSGLVTSRALETYVGAF